MWIILIHIAVLESRYDQGVEPLRCARNRCVIEIYQQEWSKSHRRRWWGVGRVALRRRQEAHLEDQEWVRQRHSTCSAGKARGVRLRHFSRSKARVGGQLLGPHWVLDLAERTGSGGAVKPNLHKSSIASCYHPCTGGGGCLLFFSPLKSVLKAALWDVVAEGVSSKWATRRFFGDFHALLPWCYW